MSDAIHELILEGCTPEPLMNYLKALGILRLVAEQKDPEARGAWKNDVFVLRSSLDREALVRFFLEEYCPTPIIVPWSGGDFFDVDRAGDAGPFKKAPTSTAVIEAFLACSSVRVSQYRQTILRALDALGICGIDTQRSMKNEAKAGYIAYLRSVLDDGVVNWVDAAAIMTAKKASFSAILGSGGGSDGNTHFSDNFMQNLWEVLPDFDSQRKVSLKGSRVDNQQISLEQLRQAVFRIPTKHLIYKRTSSLYDSGAVGGPNATQGMERESIGNPWGFILCLEGAMCLAGAMTRRHQASLASFPFQVRLSTAGSDSVAPNEVSGFEAWLPLHSSWVSFPELRSLLAEGRASMSTKIPKRGVDFAKAAAGLGVDRGIDLFQRYGIIKGRLGDTNTASSLGRFKVRFQRNVDLLGEVDRWLDNYRSAASKEKAPPRFSRVLQRIEKAIFDFSRFGGTARFSEILCALGSAERELAKGEGFRQKNYLPPIGNLSTKWLAAANNGSVEFELALSLVSIFDPERKIGAFRENLEPVIRKNSWQWAAKTGSVVWDSADLTTNLASVLARRVIDAAGRGCVNLPLASRHAASLESICAFLYNQVNDHRLEELIWGLMLIDHSQEYPRIPHILPAILPLPRSYALFKLLFLPSAIAVELTADAHRRVNLTKARKASVCIKPEFSVLSLLRAGRLNESVNIAVRRLCASGLNPKLGRGQGKSGLIRERIGSFGIQPQRLAAALLFPVSSSSVGELIDLVVRDSAPVFEQGGTL